MHRNRRALDGAHGGDHRTKPNAARMRALGKDSKVGALGDMPDAARVEIGRGDGAGNRTGRFPQSAGGITPRGLQGLPVRRGAAFTGTTAAGPRDAARVSEALSGRRSGSVNPSASSHRTPPPRSPRILRATRSSTPPPPPDSWSNHCPESSRTASEPLRPYRSSRAVLIRGFGSPSSARATGRARHSESRSERARRSSARLAQRRRRLKDSAVDAHPSGLRVGTSRDARTRGCDRNGKEKPDGLQFRQSPPATIHPPVPGMAPRAGIAECPSVTPNRRTVRAISATALRHPNASRPRAPRIGLDAGICLAQPTHTACFGRCAAARIRPSDGEFQSLPATSNRSPSGSVH